MKRTIAVLAFLSAFALAATAQSAESFWLISKQQLLSQSLNPISKRQLASMIVNAKTPSEHQQIADYYREQSVRFLAESNKYAKMRADYANTHAKGAQSWFDHRTHLMQALKAKAKKAADLASEHEQLAKEAAPR